MNVEACREDGVLHLVLAGDDELNLHCAQAVKDQARALIDGSEDFVVDLSCVTFVDSAGLGALVGLYKTARSKGRKANFICAHPTVMEIVSIIQLDRLLDFHPDATAARRALAS